MFKIREVANNHASFTMLFKDIFEHFLMFFMVFIDCDRFSMFGKAMTGVVKKSSFKVDQTPIVRRCREKCKA